MRSLRRVSKDAWSMRILFQLLMGFAPAVMGSSSRTFNAVFQSANTILQKTFGMELVELSPMPSDKDINEKDAELLKNTGVKKKGEQPTSPW